MRVYQTSAEKDTNSRGCQTGQLLHHRATHRPGKGRGLRAELIHSTFVSEDTPTVPTSRVHIIVKTPTAKVVNPQPIEQQTTVQPQK